jgi:hypothetical protein
MNTSRVVPAVASSVIIVAFVTSRNITVKVSQKKHAYELSWLLN